MFISFIVKYMTNNTDSICIRIENKRIQVKGMLESIFILRLVQLNFNCLFVIKLIIIWTINTKFVIITIECMRKHKKWHFFHDSPLGVVNFWRVVSLFYGSKSILLLWVVSKLTTRHSKMQCCYICEIYHSSGEWWVVKKTSAHTL